MKLGMKPKSISNHNTEIAWFIDLTTFLREIIELGIKNPEYSELIFSNKFAMELRQLFLSGRQRDNKSLLLHTKNGTRNYLITKIYRKY